MERARPGKVAPARGAPGVLSSAAEQGQYVRVQAVPRLRPLHRQYDVHAAWHAGASPVLAQMWEG